MRTTAILNLKGGVGKTSTAINLATILAKEKGCSVCLIDADAQHNTTDFFEVDPAAAKLKTVTRYLRKSRGDELPIPAYAHNVDVIPADDELMDLDLTKAGSGELDLFWLRDFRLLSNKPLEDFYDYCIIDCPPAFNAASASALIACNDVVIPMKLDAFAISGMANLTQQISNMQRINPSLKVAGILPTMWYSNKAIREAEEILTGSGLTVFPHIRRSPTVDRMTFTRQPLVDGKQNSAALQDYRQFAEEYIAQEVK